jgi:hypothetical protein
MMWSWKEGLIAMMGCRAKKKRKQHSGMEGWMKAKWYLYSGQQGSGDGGRYVGEIVKDFLDARQILASAPEQEVLTLARYGGQQNDVLQHIAVLTADHLSVWTGFPISLTVWLHTNAQTWLASYHSGQDLFEDLIPHALVHLERLQQDTHAEAKQHPADERQVSCYGKEQSCINLLRGKTKEAYLLGDETEMIEVDPAGEDVVPAEVEDEADPAEVEATAVGDEAVTESISMTPSCTRDGVM